MGYVGQELELFRKARNWKLYWTRRVGPHVSGRVLDVGCGLGANAELLWTSKVSHYTFLEPDADLLNEARNACPAGRSSGASFVHGDSTAVSGPYDTILYADVLEHIAADKQELSRAVALLAPGGQLIVLAPAFASLYSPFDRAIGHHRRYTRRTLAAIAPDTLRSVRSEYLDGLGCILSLGNRFISRREVPTEAQIAFWDRWIIPLSERIDLIIGRSFGRSVMMVWQKPHSHAD